MVGTMDAVGRWWDGVELWIAGLPFVPQVGVLLLAVVPVVALAVYVVDTASSVLLDARRRVFRRGDRQTEIPRNREK